MMTRVRGDLPTGTVTFLFTDVEASTKLLQELGADRYARALAEHRRILRKTFSAHGGAEVDTQGDAFFVAFPTAQEAVRSAAEAMAELASGPIRVRIGVHTGTPSLAEDGYVGVDVHRAARIAAAGHGGQVLISASTAALLGNDDVRDLGEHRLKDLAHPQRLYQLVIPGLETEFPSLKTLGNRPTNLPALPTPLIGREHDLAQTADLLRGDETRLLTLTGAAGTGKTRLSLQLAADLLEEFPEGVFLVELAAISDPSLVISTIAQTLAVRERPSDAIEKTLSEYLHERRLLLLLDNFERLIAGAPSIAALLATSPHLKLLITSRAPLRLAGEQEYAVQPLTLPDPENLPELAALSQYEAVALFVERARAVRADFEMTSRNARAVAEICVRLDGLPLAIELAAARIRALTPHALLRRLDQRLELLTGGPREAPGRQQTMRRAISWSYALLSRRDQRLLSRLSVFVGGCDLEAAEAVCDFDGRVGPVLEGISSLIENSLLVAQDDPPGEPRYSMLETIREYASDKLSASSETDTLRRRHAEYFSRLGARWERTLHYFAPASPGERTMTRQMVPLAETYEPAPDLDNVRAALRWSIEAANSEFALRLAAWSGGLFFFLNPAEGRRWLDEALALSPPTCPQFRAEALRVAGALANETGDYGAAADYLKLSLAQWKLVDDPTATARTMVGLAQTARARTPGELDGPRALLEQALEIYESVSDVEGTCSALHNLGRLERHAGNNAKAKRWLDRALSLAEDEWRAAAILHSLADVALNDHKLERAEKLFRDSLVAMRNSYEERDIAYNLAGLSAVAAAQKCVTRAGRLVGAVKRVEESRGAPLFLVNPGYKRLLDAAPISPEDVQAGRALTIDEAVAYALEPRDANDPPAARSSTT
jgi:predicted ATPase/class 3 adenylate cyclase